MLGGRNTIVKFEKNSIPSNNDLAKRSENSAFLVHKKGNIMAFYKLNEIQGKGRRVVDTVTDDINEARMFGGNSIGATDKRGFSGYYNLDTRRAGAYRNITAQPREFSEVFNEFRDMLTPSSEAFEYILKNNILDDEAQTFFGKEPKVYDTEQKLFDYLQGKTTLEQIKNIPDDIDEIDELTELVNERLATLDTPQTLFEISNGSWKVMGIFEYYDGVLTFSVKDTINMGGMPKTVKEAVREFRSDNEPVQLLADEVDAMYVVGRDPIALNELFAVNDVKDEAEELLQYIAGNAVDYQKARLEIAEITGFALSIFPMNKTSQALYTKYNANEMSAIEVVRQLGIEAQSIKAIVRKIEGIDTTELAHRYVEQHFDKGFVTIKQGKEKLVKAGATAIETMVNRINGNNVFEYQGTAEYPNVLVRELVRDMEHYVSDDDIVFEEVDESIAKITEVLENFDGERIEAEGAKYVVKVLEVDYTDDDFVVTYNFDNDTNTTHIKLASPATIRQTFKGILIEQVANGHEGQITAQSLKSELYDRLWGERAQRFASTEIFSELEFSTSDYVEELFQKKSDVVNDIISGETAYSTLEVFALNEFLGLLKATALNQALVVGAKNFVNDEGQTGYEYLAKMPVTSFNRFVIDRKNTGLQELGFQDTRHTIPTEDKLHESQLYTFDDYHVTIEAISNSEYNVTIKLSSPFLEILPKVAKVIGELKFNIGEPNVIHADFDQAEKFAENAIEVLANYIRNIRDNYLENQLNPWFEEVEDQLIDYVMDNHRVDRRGAMAITKRAYKSIHYVYYDFVEKIPLDMATIQGAIDKLKKEPVKISGIRKLLDKTAVEYLNS